MKKSIFLMCLLIAQLFALSTHAASDPRSIKGTVVDTEGEPLIGATVQVEGTSVGVSTDIDGNFVIRAAAGKTLLVSYVGYSPKKVKVTDSTADLRVELSLNAEMLEDVVVVGYGVMKKKPTLQVPSLRSTPIRSRIQTRRLFRTSFVAPQVFR